MRTSLARIVSRLTGCVAGLLQNHGAVAAAADDKHRYGIDRRLLRVSDDPAAGWGAWVNNRSGSLAHHGFDYSDNRARSSSTFAISSCRRGSRASSVPAKSWIR